MMTYFKNYSIEKRKKIALWCAIIFGIVLLGILVVVYDRPQVSGEKGLSALITSGYTTIVESALVLFVQK